MCGIAGWIDFGATTSVVELKSQAQRMSDALTRRGPDAQGVWCDEKNGVAFSHRRLSILDLSETGAQPMISHAGRFVITFNGEIYNYEKIRNEFVASGVLFKGSSDTEVLLQAIEAWGIHETLVKLEGMFAFAVYDRQTQKIFLARDRLGEKPLYYCTAGKNLWFASELTAIRNNAEWKKHTWDINQAILESYLNFGYISAPHTIYKNVYKLLPGKILEVDLKLPGIENIRSYWSVGESIRKNSSAKFSSGEETRAIDQLENLLKGSVARQMVTDVPYGAFLSGGVDSSSVVAMMQEQSKTPVSTFCIGFDEMGFNEAEYGRAVALHLGTNHTELVVGDREAIDVVPQLSRIYDEPFADSSQIPTYLVSKLAKTKVSVSLSGDGGDELFAGYNRHVHSPKLWNKVKKVPYFLRSPAAYLIEGASPASMNALIKLGSMFSEELKQTPLMQDKAKKVGRLLGSKSESELYFALQSQLFSSDHLLNLKTPSIFPKIGEDWDKIEDPVVRQQYMDLIHYLPNDILTKVDRASMAVSLEARVPFLSEALIDFSWKLPTSMKVKDGKGKWILRELLYRRVPQELIDRPKAGFAVPISAWLRGPLREWAENLLSEQELSKQSWWNVKAVRKLWVDHLSAKSDRGALLWNVLMLQDWLRN